MRHKHCDPSIQLQLSSQWRNFSEQFCSAEPQASSSQWTALTWYISFDWVVPWFSLVHSLTIEQIEVQVKILTQKTCRYITLDICRYIAKQENCSMTSHLSSCQNMLMLLSPFFKTGFILAMFTFLHKQRRYQAVKMLLAVDSTAQTFTFHAPAGYSNDTARRKV